jgi:hypothetical protein
MKTDTLIIIIGVIILGILVGINVAITHDSTRDSLIERQEETITSLERQVVEVKSQVDELKDTYIENMPVKGAISMCIGDLLACINVLEDCSNEVNRLKG